MSRSFLAAAAVALAAMLYTADRYDIPSWLVYQVKRRAFELKLTLRPVVVSDEEIFDSLLLSPDLPGPLREAVEERSYGAAWEQYWKLRSRHSTSKVFVDPEDRPRLVAFLKQSYPRELQKIVAAADRYVGDRFSPFGSGDAVLGDDFWWTDFPPGNNDVIFIWEINTLQHLTLLAQAYVLTGRRQYFETIVRHLESWTAGNPIENSVNWRDPMEVSLRLHSLLWTGEILAGEGASRDLFPLLTKTVFAHARYVSDHMDRPRKRNNHGIFAPMGLYFFAVNYPELARSAGWKSYAEERILEELELQYTDSGVHKEYAPCYHLPLLDSYLQYLVAKIRLGESVPERVRRRIEAQVSFLRDVSGDDGVLFLMGDSSDHHFLRMTVDSYASSGPTLHLGSLLFSTPEFSAPAPAAVWESAWLLGYGLFDRLSSGLGQAGASPGSGRPELRVYRDEGFVRIRNGHLLFFGDFSRFGREAVFMGHNHCDITSFLLYEDGRAIVTDPGTFTYRRSLRSEGVRWRDFLRSAAAHNTTVVDGLSQAVPINDFEYGSWPEAGLLAAGRSGDLFLVVGEHRAYESAAGRSLRIFVMGGRSLLAIDWFPESAGRHAYETNLLLEQEDAKLLEGRVILEDGILLCMDGEGAERRILRGSYDPPGGWRSPSYGSLVEAAQFRCRRMVEGPAVMSFLVNLEDRGKPGSGGEPVLRPLSGGRYAVLASFGGDSVVVLLNQSEDRSASPAGYGGCTTDALVAAFREGGDARYAVVFGGAFFRSPDSRSRVTYLGRE